MTKDNNNIPAPEEEKAPSQTDNGESNSKDNKKRYPSILGKIGSFYISSTVIIPLLITTIIAITPVTFYALVHNNANTVIQDRQFDHYMKAIQWLENEATERHERLDEIAQINEKIREHYKIMEETKGMVDEIRGGTLGMDELAKHLAKQASEDPNFHNKVKDIIVGKSNSVITTECRTDSYKQKDVIELRLHCKDNEVMSEIYFKHPHGQNLTYQESVRITCCKLETAN